MSLRTYISSRLAMCLYQILLAMKYLRSSDKEWTVFVDAFDKLIQKNISAVSLTAMNLPVDWKAHLSV